MSACVHPKCKPHPAHVYIAGPYTSPDPAANVHAAVMAAAELLDRGDCVPIVPHLTHLWHLIDPRPYEDWIAYDLALLGRCDAVLRLPGDSPGADGEVLHAASLGIPTFHHLDDVHDWATRKARP